MNTEDKKYDFRILLAEDDIDDQELLREAFIDVYPSIKMTIATNGAKAISYLENLAFDQLPDLIILDYNMPELDGAQVLQILGEQEQYKQISKIVLSTSHSPYYKENCLSLGADGYFTKPSSYNELEALIKEILQLCLLKKGKEL